MSKTAVHRDTTDLPELRFEPHCILKNDDGSETVLEWRVVAVGGSLLMVTKNRQLAQLLASAPTLIRTLREIAQFGQGGTNLPQTNVGLSTALTWMQSHAAKAIAQT